MKITEFVSEDWQKTNRKDKTSGMSRKAVKAYRRENPGSKLQTAVTTKPSKLKKGSKSAKRRKSFCARMRGMKKSRTSAKTARNPNSNINKALRRWNCESIEQMQELVMIAEQKIAALRQGMAEGLHEMDKSAPQPGRDGRVSHKTYGSRDTTGERGTQHTAKPQKAKDAAKDAEKIINKIKIKEGEDLSQYSTERLKAYVKKVSGGGVPAFGSGARLKRVQAELKRREQGVAEGSLNEGVMDQLKRIYMMLVSDLPMGTPESEFLEHWQRIIQDDLGKRIDIDTLAKLRNNFVGRYKTLGRRGDAADWHREMGQDLAEGSEDIVAVIDGVRSDRTYNDRYHAHNSLSKLVGYGKAKVAELYINGEKVEHFELGKKYIDFEPKQLDAMSEAGPFSYGAKKPRKGSVADLAAKKRKEQERDRQPAEPQDHMVGIARVKK